MYQYIWKAALKNNAAGESVNIDIIMLWSVV